MNLDFIKYIDHTENDINRKSLNICPWCLDSALNVRVDNLRAYCISTRVVNLNLRWFYKFKQHNHIHINTHTHAHIYPYILTFLYKIGNTSLQMSVHFNPPKC